jgi:hypothetical protein
MSSSPPAGTPLTGIGILPTIQSNGAYLYWFLGLVAALGIAYVLYKMNFQIAAVLVFLGAVIALFYYYVKWFQIPSNTATWPPTTTPCPDFLTLVSPGVCMDFVGVSSNGRLKKSNPTRSAEQGSDPQYAFKIDTSKGATTDLCQKASEYGLTWSSICPE